MVLLVAADPFWSTFSEDSPGAEFAAFDRLGIYRKALECFEKAEQAGERSWKLAIYKGKTLKKLGHPPKAILLTPPSSCVARPKRSLFYSPRTTLAASFMLLLWKTAMKETSNLRFIPCTLPSPSLCSKTNIW